MPPENKGRGFANRPKLLLLTPSSPYSTRGFSGTFFFIREAMQAQLPSLQILSFGYVVKIARIINRIMGLFIKNPNVIFHKFYGKVVSLIGSVIVSFYKPDAIIAVAASPYIAYMRTKVPIVYCSDATFAAISRIYEEFDALPTWSKAGGEDFEARSLERADLVVVSSQWAKNSAVDDYSIKPNRVAVISYGPNIPRNLLPKDRPQSNLETGSTLNFLFIGMNWERKGGDIAIETVRELRTRGIDARLHLVGRVPKQVDNFDFVDNHGHLDKERSSDLSALINLYKFAHFLILPTRADATPVVFNEAAAFGVPSISFDVGGVSSSIEHGVSGLIFELDASPHAMADELSVLLSKPGWYDELRRQTFDRYVQKANWDQWAKEVIERTLPLAVDGRTTRP